ncbi:MAG TPA: TIGR03086 family metal-binding protein [Nocardioides sp.]|uniref:TIGR03086 family metal-binding protein n=1 Tax=Nocardioides sp. TaxID=35761 RepID=UPI002D80F10C|nr:TIGR03086 family metal-binding protein [Nocardioides sp.]HET6651823.1 TIGR03086 family metal-binding protein [Nocardioides sp.]
MSASAGAVLGAALLEAPALLERAVAYTRASLALLPRAAPDAPTPCADWDLVRLLRHMDDALAAFSEAAESGYVAPDGPADEQPALLATSLRARACRLLGAWANEPGRPVVSVLGHDLDTTVLAAAGALEIAVHGWDVAQACGEDRPLPESLAETLLAVAPLVVRAEDRPGRFAAPFDLPPTATGSDRLLAFLGRTQKTLR